MEAGPLSAEDVLAAWEAGAGRVPAARSLALAAAACGASEDELARLPVGELDGRLLDVRARTFGERLEAVAACPGCSEQLEVEFRTWDIRVEPPERTGDGGGGDGDGGGVLLRAGELRFRLPQARDLIAAAAAPDAESARRLLIERCVDGRAAGALSRSEELAVAEEMARADPQADVRLALTCPECGRGFEAPFDIGDYLWSEVEARALRLLGEVHLLARAYGWSEGEVLGLSETRRRFYVEAAQA